jgi:hypothetical protein
MTTPSSTLQAALAAVRAHPKDPQAWLTLGNVLASEGDKAKAKECYERALALDPLMSEAHAALGEMEKPPPKPKRARKPKAEVVVETPVPPPARVISAAIVGTPAETPPETPKQKGPKPIVMIFALLTLCVCGSMIFADPKPPDSASQGASAPEAATATRRIEPTTAQSAATAQARTRRREATAQALVAAATGGPSLATPTLAQAEATPEPAAPPEPTDAPSVPLVTVLNPELNARAGPGTDYGIVLVVKQGDVLPALGYSPDRNWVQVVLPDGQKGWVSSGNQFVTVSLAEALPTSTDFAALPTAAPPPPATGGGTSGGSRGGYTGPYDPFGPDRNCGDFATQREAQAFYIAAGGPGSDRHRLDNNRDGVACESLP